MNGYYYDYKNDANDKDKTESSTFFTYDFVIMNIKNDTHKENIENGFNIQLDTPEFNNKGKKGLQICPLNIGSKCLIYEDRPQICRIFKCKMKTDNGWHKQ